MLGIIMRSLRMYVASSRIQKGTHALNIVLIFIMHACEIINWLIQMLQLLGSYM